MNNRRFCLGESFLQSISKDKINCVNKIIGNTWVISDTTDGFTDMQTLSWVWESQSPGKSTNNSFEIVLLGKRNFIFSFLGR